MSIIISSLMFDVYKHLLPVDIASADASIFN